MDSVMLKHSQDVEILNKDEEFHGSAMMRAADDPWRKIPLRLRIKIYSDALKVIHDSGCRIYIEGVNIRAQQSRGYAELTPARELAFGHLLERINDCGKEANKTLIQVTADEHHTSEISRSNFSKYRTQGTPGYRSSTLPYIADPLNFEPSNSNRVLQAADLVTYIYNRWKTLPNASPKAIEAQNNLWEIIAPAANWPRGRARIWP